MDDFGWLVVAVHLSALWLVKVLGFDASHVSATSRGGLASTFITLQFTSLQGKGGSSTVNWDDATATRHVHT